MVARTRAEGCYVLYRLALAVELLNLIKVYGASIPTFKRLHSVTQRKEEQRVWRGWLNSAMDRRT